MKIPEVREALLDIATDLERIHELPHQARKIRALVDQMRRRPFTRKKHRVSKPVTSDIIHGVLYLARVRKDWTQIEIAKHLDINPARVSEILRGKRQ